MAHCESDLNAEQSVEPTSLSLGYSLSDANPAFFNFVSVNE